METLQSFYGLRPPKRLWSIARQSLSGGGEATCAIILMASVATQKQIPFANGGCGVGKTSVVCHFDPNRPFRVIMMAACPRCIRGKAILRTQWAWTIARRWTKKKVKTVSRYLSLFLTTSESQSVNVISLRNTIDIVNIYIIYFFIR